MAIIIVWLSLSASCLHRYRTAQHTQCPSSSGCDCGHCSLAPSLPFWSFLIFGWCVFCTICLPHLWLLVSTTTINAGQCCCCCCSTTVLMWLLIAIRCTILYRVSITAICSSQLNLVLLSTLRPFIKRLIVALPAHCFSLSLSVLDCLVCHLQVCFFSFLSHDQCS